MSKNTRNTKVARAGLDALTDGEINLILAASISRRLATVEVHWSNEMRSWLNKEKIRPGEQRPMPVFPPNPKGPLLKEVLGALGGQSGPDK